jgi:hypothetical protein
VDNPSSDGDFPEYFPAGETLAAESTGAKTTATSPTGQTSRKAGIPISALAGLQAGIVGALWMFACFAMAAIWNGRSIWAIPNLFSSAFYGDDAYQDEFLRSTWAGLAVIIVAYGLMGAVWGCFWGDRRRPLLSFFGALTGLAVCFVFFDFVWPKVNPMIPLYAPVRQLQLAHIVWGMMLAKSPGYARRIAEAARPAPAGHGMPGASEEPQIVTGELIR